MKKMVIKYPDGSNHNVTVTSAKRCVNLVTGNMDVMVEYIDHSTGNQECYTPIMNVLGKWYKNPNHGSYEDYIVFNDDKYDFMRELPSKMDSYHDAIYREIVEAEKIKHYVHDVVEYIVNMIKNKSPELLKSPRISNLLARLEKILMGAYNHFFNDDGQHFEWSISFMMRWNIFSNIFNSLDSEDSLAQALESAINAYTPLTNGYYSVTSRNEQISQIISDLRILGIYVQTDVLNNVILSLRSVNIMLFDVDMFNHFIREIRSVIDQLGTFTFDWDNVKLSQLSREILSIIMRYENMLKNVKKQMSVPAKVKAKAFDFQLPPPPPGGPNHPVVNDKLFYKYNFLNDGPPFIENYEYKPKRCRKHYVALPPSLLFGNNEKIMYQGFEVIKDYPADSSVISYYISFLFSNGVNIKKMIGEYIKLVKTRWLNEGALYIFPLYVEHKDGITDIYCFGVCETDEKFMDVARAYQIDVYIPDDCPFRKGALCEGAFRYGMEGKYPIQIVDGKYYGVTDVNNVKKKSSGRR